ncbi:uncharacterized protein LOC126048132 [Accipiter gentilis]|uniref:uncharacterized protein LOC126048132 n=1 Tax=Astur gentilis TaxID=8957 RepID=UPI0021103283|nr:uncharacterized protein LOC126048132 [Accipiter gentilis]
MRAANQPLVLRVVQIGPDLYYLALRRGRSAAPAGPGPAGLSAAAAERAVSATGGRPSWLALAKTAGCLAVTGASSQVIDTNVQKKGKIRPERYRSEPPKSSRPPLNVARQKLPFDCYFNCGEMTALLGEMVCSQRRLSPETRSKLGAHRRAYNAGHLQSSTGGTHAAQDPGGNPPPAATFLEPPRKHPRQVRNHSDFSVFREIISKTVITARSPKKSTQEGPSFLSSTHRKAQK